jgi:hypothetical protein
VLLADAGQAEAAVWTVAVVVLDVGTQDALEFAAACDQEPVEALPTYRANEALGICVLAVPGSVCGRS